MNSAYSKEVYHVNKTYLEGWYSMEDLKRIIETAERINDVNKQMAEEIDNDSNSKSSIR
jgi:hypothetical protein